MALVVGTNAYSNAADASIFFADRYGTSEWDAILLGDQNKALVSATDLQDTLCEWEGYKTDEAQDLEFPRDGDTEVPNDIIVSSLEIALEIVKQSVASFVDAGESLKQLKAGSVNLSFYEAVSTPITVVNSKAKTKLSRYGSCSFGGNSIQVVGLSR